MKNLLVVSSLVAFLSTPAFALQSSTGNAQSHGIKHSHQAKETATSKVDAEVDSSSVKKGKKTKKKHHKHSAKNKTKSSKVQR